MHHLKTLYRYILIIEIVYYYNKINLHVKKKIDGYDGLINISYSDNCTPVNSLKSQ